VLFLLAFEAWTATGAWVCELALLLQLLELVLLLLVLVVVSHAEPAGLTHCLVLVRNPAWQIHLSLVVLVHSLLIGSL
jgi:hypothetical protein